MLNIEHVHCSGELPHESILDNDAIVTSYCDIPTCISHVNSIFTSVTAAVAVQNPQANLNDIIIGTRVCADVEMLPSKHFYLHWCAIEFHRKQIWAECFSDTMYVHTHITDTPHAHIRHVYFCPSLSPPTPNSTTERQTQFVHVAHIWFSTSFCHIFLFMFTYITLQLYVYISLWQIGVRFFSTFVHFCLFLSFSLSFFHSQSPSLSLPFSLQKCWWLVFVRSFCLMAYINMILWLWN